MAIIHGLEEALAEVARLQKLNESLVAEEFGELLIHAVLPDFLERTYAQLVMAVLRATPAQLTTAAICAVRKGKE